MLRRQTRDGPLVEALAGGAQAFLHGLPVGGELQMHVASVDRVGAGADGQQAAILAQEKSHPAQAIRAAAYWKRGEAAHHENLEA